MGKYILRLERHGEGVYYCSAVSDAGITLDEQWHPSPYYDELEQKLKTCHHFGFSGIRTYLQWFYKPEWRANLKDVGVKLRIYKVAPEYLIQGAHQVMFTMSAAELVTEVDCTIFDELLWELTYPELAQVLDHAN